MGLFQLPVEDILNNKPTSVEKKKICKRNWCCYCGSLQSKISRHFTTKHKDVEEIKMYMKITDPDKKKEIVMKREACKLIIYNSNRIYNDLILKGKTAGTAIQARTAKSTTSISHVICNDCGALLTKKNFSCHQSACRSRRSLLGMENSNKNPSSSIFCKASVSDSKYKVLFESVINKMNKDEVCLVAQSDPLILEFGRRFFSNHKSEKHRNYVSSKMRTLATLLIRLRKAYPDIFKNMADCVVAGNFNELCQEVIKWSQYEEKSGLCNVASVPRRLRKPLINCSEILLSVGLRDRNVSEEELSKMKARHDRFKRVMEADWSEEVNSAGDSSLKVKKLIDEAKMPTDNDIVTFFSEMTDIIKSCINNLEKSPIVGNYNLLTQALVAWLTAFNSRRPSEVAYATLQNYEKRIHKKTTPEDDEPLAVFTVAATKNDVRVPVIVTPLAEKALLFLVKCRSKLNIQGQLLLGKEDGSAYNGSNLISKFKTRMKLEKPQDFCANGLRHYWATQSQKDPNVKRHMPKFLGHTLLTHQKFYEMNLSDINLNVIGPLLVHQCLQSKSTQNSTNKDDNEVECRKSPEHEAPQFNLKQQKTPLKRKRLFCRKNPDDIESTDSSGEEPATPPLNMRMRNRWLTPEKEELFERLPNAVLGISHPIKGEIKAMWENSKFKDRHNLQTTRIEISKYFTKKKKVPTPIRKRLLSKVDNQAQSE